jgi:circadian clock protein KaiC
MHGVFVDDLTEEEGDPSLHSLVHGVIRLEQLTIAYGSERRRLRVFKMRGRSFRGGYHDYIIRKGGLQIFRAWWHRSTSRPSTMTNQ